ncbi:hypothetical protein Tco_0519383 [Tanacetum coccineum]
MCMFALTDELHQFDRLKGLGTVDKHLKRIIIIVKWFRKEHEAMKINDCNSKQSTILLLKKGYAQEAGIDFENHLHQLSLGSSLDFLRRFCCSARGSLTRSSEKKLPYAKALYGLKQAPRAGMMELSNFLITEYQLADMFTKAFPEDRFKYLVRRIGMRCLTPADLEVLTNETA